MKALQLFQALRPYLEMNLLLILGYFAFRMALAGSSLRKIRPDHLRWLRTAQLLVLCAAAFPCVVLVLPRQALLRPSAQIWSGTRRGTSERFVAVAPILNPAEDSAGGSEAFLLKPGSLLVALALLLAGMLASGAVYLLRVRALRRSLRSMIEIRRIGRVSILVCERAAVAYSVWLPGRCHVVLPESVLAHAEDYRITLRHEIQHHRQGDTKWIHFAEGLKALFFWNPAIYGWARFMARLQEFACDEVLIGHRKISPQAYGSCLLKAAESAMGSRSLPAGTTGMAAAVSGSLLKRRVEMLFNNRKVKKSRGAATVLGLGLIFLMAGAAFASRSAIQDRTITMAEAQALAVTASSGAGLPITVNELVLEKLNAYLGTPEGRKFVRGAFARKPAFETMINRKIGEYGLPPELLAIAMHESGLRNDVVSPGAHAAGIWQFIAQTARRYDLVVDAKQDERFDTEKETDAAMRYLRDLNVLFKDWRLAFKAYNEGESRVQYLIDHYKTRDPWVLERASSRESYLSGAMAMIILLKNPSWVVSE